MQTNLDWHFWFSKQQWDLSAHYQPVELMRALCPPGLTVYRPRRNFAFIEGKILEYTLASNNLDHGADWEDIIYLGRGRYDHSEPF